MDAPMTEQAPAMPEGPGQDAGNDTWAQDMEDARAVLQEYEPHSLLDGTTRVIQAFLDNLPPDGQHALAVHVHRGAESGTRLRELRNCLVDSLLKPFKVAGGTTPKFSSISGPGEPEDIAEASGIADSMKPSTRAQQESLKKHCHLRDGYRCVLTNRYDIKSVEKDRIPTPPGATVAHTECAHIIPFQIRSFGTGRRERESKAAVWWALRRYFPTSIGTLSSDAINQAGNAITLSVEAHKLFGEFTIALVPNGNAPNQYRVRRFGVLAHAPPAIPIEDEITFRANDASVPLPSPGYLDIHSRIAQILQVSGIGRKIDHALAVPEPGGVDPTGSTELGEVIARKLLISI